MAAVMSDRHIVCGQGTPESTWLRSAPWRDAPEISVEQLLPPGRRAVVVAPHPDDEVLAVGGLLALLARRGQPICVLAVTDGTASHPGSVLWSGARLAIERPREQRRALAHLGCGAAVLTRMCWPDGGLMDVLPALQDAIADCIDAEDVLFAPWCLDGHPDHEAVGRACAHAARRRHASLVEVPIWGWHWAQPYEPCWPRPRARRLALDAEALKRKQAALMSFQSQLMVDPSTGAGPVLDALSLERAHRPFEYVFV